MTTLALAHKKLISFRFISFLFTLREKLEYYNTRNLAGRLMLVALIFFVASYLIALFISFSYGFQIQKQAVAEKEFAKTLRETELILQRKMDLLATGGVSELESMERVSSIRYLRPENVAISQSSLRP